MPVIELATSGVAPIERVFDLARSIDLHLDSTSSSGERTMPVSRLEFLEFMDQVVAAHPGKGLHVILDNVSTTGWRMTSGLRHIPK